MKKRDGDLPKTVVVLLIFLAVFISVLGTWTVIKEINSRNTVMVDSGTPVAGGEVSIQIVDEPEKTSSAEGKISLEIQGGP